MNRMTRPKRKRVRASKAKMNKIKINPIQSGGVIKMENVVQNTNGVKVASALRQMQSLLLKARPKDKTEKEIRAMLGVKRYEEQ